MMDSAIVTILVLLVIGAVVYFNWKDMRGQAKSKLSDPAIYLRSIDRNLRLIKNCIVWVAIFALISAVIAFLFKS